MENVNMKPANATITTQGINDPEPEFVGSPQIDTILNNPESNFLSESEIPVLFQSETEIPTIP